MLTKRFFVALGISLAVHLSISSVRAPVAQLPLTAPNLTLHILAKPKRATAHVAPQPSTQSVKHVGRAGSSVVGAQTTFPQDAQPAPPPFSESGVPTPVLPSAKESAPAHEEVAKLASKELDVRAYYLDNPLPNYPERSRELGEEGRVEVKVAVGKNGQVQQIFLHRSSGFSRLDDAALNAVRYWRFVPAKRGMEPIDSWLIIPIPFRIMH